MKKIIRLAVILSSFLTTSILAFAAMAPVDEKAVADFYRGKTVRLLSDFQPAAVTMPIPG